MKGDELEKLKEQLAAAEELLNELVIEKDREAERTKEKAQILSTELETMAERRVRRLAPQLQA